MATFKSVSDNIRSILEGFFSDEELRETVTYKRYKEQSFDKVKGHTSTTYDSFSLVAVRLKHNVRSARESQGDVQAGDDLFMFRAEGMPGGLSLKDLIVDAESNILKVAAIDNIFNIVVSVTVELGGEI